MMRLKKKKLIPQHRMQMRSEHSAPIPKNRLPRNGLSDACLKKNVYIKIKQKKQ